MKIPQLVHRLLHRKKTGAELVCAAVVPAAGSSTRMAGQDKLLLPLHDGPVLLHTLRALEGCPLISEIVVATRSDLVVPIGQLCRDAGLQKVKKIVVGGASRAETVLNGVLEVSPEADLIAIHDGARPLVTEELMEKAITCAGRTGAAAPAVPVKDTIKHAVDHVVDSTPDRSALFAVQTPQVFDADLIRAALTKALEEKAEITDDCSAVERMGMKVTLTEGDYTNLKITTPEDMAVAEALMDWRKRQ